MNYTLSEIDALRSHIGGVMSEFRFNHTLGVERMAARLSELYCPEKELMLRAAALLHDVTKDYGFEEQLAVFEKYGVKPTEEQLAAMPTIHALTAALIIPDAYPYFAETELIDAVRYHSTGRADMTLYDKIIYLSDYIEDTRKFEDCIALREEFYSAEPEKMDEKERIAHLNRVLLHAIEITVADLEEKGRAIDSFTLEAAEGLRIELIDG